jgi:hypothetical protein
MKRAMSVFGLEAKHMGTFRNETIKWLPIGLGIVVALYLSFVMIPMAQVPLYAEDGVRKSGLRRHRGPAAFSRNHLVRTQRKARVFRRALLPTLTSHRMNSRLPCVPPS